MKSICILFLVVIILGVSFSAYGESAAKSCQAFIDNRSLFHDVQDFYPCEYFENKFSKIPQEGRCISLGKDKNALVLFNGTCSGQRVGIINQKDKSNLLKGRAKNATVNGWGMRSADILLKYNGDYYITDDEGSALEKVIDDSSLILCSFHNKVVRWKIERATDKEICQKFIDHDYKFSWGEREDGAEGMRNRDTFFKGDLERENHVGKLGVFPVSDDETGIILSMELDSGRTCGCRRARWLRAVGGVNQASVVPASILDQELLTLTDEKICMAPYDWEILAIDGKSYVAKTNKNPSDKFSDQQLYKFKDGKFKEVCTVKAHLKREFVTSSADFTAAE